MIAPALAAIVAFFAPQDPVKVGILSGASKTADAGPSVARVAGARFVADAWNARGGVDGAPIEVVVAHCTKRSEVAAAVDSLTEQGVVSMLAPLDAELAAAAKRATRGKVACVHLEWAADDVLAMLNRLFEEHHLVTRIALVRDTERSARDFAKRLKGEGLAFPTELVLELDLRKDGKKLAKALAKARPEILVVDALPEAAAKYLREQWAGSKIPTVLTPRAFGPAILAAGLDSLIVLGRSPATRRAVGGGTFRERYEKAHGTIAFGVTEGFEAMTMAVRAIDAADSRELSAVLAAVDGITAEGARGLVEFDQKRGAAVIPVAVWRLRGQQTTPYFPPVLSIAAAMAGTEGPGEREPDQTLGESFGERRLREFEFEPGTQWVHCTWGYGQGDTIDQDLMLLGLSTGGEDLLVDRIIKDELMTRILSITSLKFGRNADGTRVPGKSLKISFSAYRPDVKKRRLWPAKFAGDDSAAGGRAFGTRCEIYSSFIRRTIFQDHALTPAVTAEDLPYLDGSYEFGTDHIRDKRSELIRALINGYGGSMALTAAHEVGHLCGLGHITDDPTGIMNVAEGAGIDYRDAGFSTGSWEKLVDRLKLSEELDKKRR